MCFVTLLKCSTILLFISLVLVSFIPFSLMLFASTSKPILYYLYLMYLAINIYWYSLFILPIFSYNLFTSSHVLFFRIYEDHSHDNFTLINPNLMFRKNNETKSVTITMVTCVIKRSPYARARSK